MTFDFKHLYQSKKFRIVLACVGIAAVGMVIFSAGVAIGFRKAAFSYRFGEGYYRVFDAGRMRDERGGGMMGFFDEDLPGGHGAMGQVIRITPPTFIVSSPDNTERVVMVNDDTIVRRFRDTASTSDIKVDDFVVTIGSPDENGRINAKFVRIMPRLASTTGGMTNMMYFR